MSSSGAPSSGGSFRVDLEQAPQAIKELEAAKQELTDIRLKAMALGRVDPGSNDSVSRDAAVMLGAVAVGGQGSLTAALEAGIDRIQWLIEALTADLREQQRTETANAEAFHS